MKMFLPAFYPVVQSLAMKMFLPAFYPVVQSLAMKHFLPALHPMVQILAMKMFLPAFYPVVQSLTMKMFLPAFYPVVQSLAGFIFHLSFSFRRKESGLITLPFPFNFFFKESCFSFRAKVKQKIFDFLLNLFKNFSYKICSIQLYFLHCNSNKLVLMETPH
jgi:hypothetical protein